MTLHCLPLLQDPPIHLAIVLANDSEGHFESPPDRPNGIDEAVKKLRVAAYLWQAYTAEQMFRNFPGSPNAGGSARRSFRIEEEWSDDTLSLQETDVWRMTAKVHIVRSELTVDGMCDMYLTYDRNARTICDFGRESIERACARCIRAIWRTIQTWR